MGYLSGIGPFEAKGELNWIITGISDDFDLDTSFLSLLFLLPLLIGSSLI